MSWALFADCRNVFRSCAVDLWLCVVRRDAAEARTSHHLPTSTPETAPPIIIDERVGRDSRRRGATVGSRLHGFTKRLGGNSWTECSLLAPFPPFRLTKFAVTTAVLGSWSFSLSTSVGRAERESAASNTHFGPGCPWPTGTCGCQNCP